ncbi:MAG: TonB-dependent receptor [Bacteroidales bacterium]|nr:TonB-dependent receptor [Bacteroidales bacterium]
MKRFLILTALIAALGTSPLLSAKDSDPVFTEETANIIVKGFVVKEASVEQCLELIRKQTGIGFLHDGEDDLAQVGSITLNQGEIALEKLLDTIFKGTGYGWEIRGRAIIVRKEKEAAIAAVALPEKTDPAQGSVTLTLKVKLEGEGEGIPGAVCTIENLGMYAISDYEGTAVMNKVPAGKINLGVVLLGYEEYHKTIYIAQDMTLEIVLKESNLELEEVVVTAQSSAAGTSTSSSIGRMAMDHLQATTLKDIMQLIPGQLMSGASDMTGEQKLTIRTLNNSSANNAFGTSILVDGVPISDNSSISDKVAGSTGGTGVDLRQIGTDNIESVEVIRGIPSAEYGDLTSGAVVVNTKAGQTPFEVRLKLNPSTFNTSLGKGFKVSRKGGHMNVNADYARASGDPRVKNRSFDRISGGITYSNTFNRIWYTNTKINFSNLIDMRTTDPDVIVEGTETSQKQNTIRFSHNGKLSFNKKLSRTLSYALGFSASQNDSRTSAIVAADGGLAVISSLTDGYYQVPYITESYRAEGGNTSTPRTFYSKASNMFYANTEHLKQRFNMGVEYKYETNDARGFFNYDDEKPLRPNSNGRPRPYYEIPDLSQLSGFFEDNIAWNISEQVEFKLQAGVRFDMLQMGLPEHVASVSPRLNASLKLTPWMTLRGGWGQNSKTPGLAHLYPEKKYTDRLAASYLPSDPSKQLVLYNVKVTEVERNNNLKNATNTKSEVGVDLNFKNGMSFSIVGYNDKMANGFGSLIEYDIYNANYYALGQGIKTDAEGNPVIEWDNPARVDTVFTTNGRIGNTKSSLDRGVEYDFNLGRIHKLNTTIFVSGAYMETQLWDCGPSYSNPVGIPAGSVYAQGEGNTPPFKLLYPSGTQKDISRRFSTVLRFVTNIPRMKMVASISNQVVWYNYTHTTNQKRDPIAWIDTDLSRHEITKEMLADPSYTIKGISLADQRKNPADSNPVTQKPLWIMNMRLTKNISKNAGFSFYVNNAMFYTPYQSSSHSGTLSERNTGTFSFGMELFIKI